MEEVLHYLDLKNQYYDKFLRLTEKFLSGAIRNEWESITTFTDTRERILSIIHHYDFRIAEVFSELDLQPAQVEQYRVRVKAMLDKRAELVHRIVDTDLEIISLIDEMKSEQLRDLRSTLETHESITDPAFTQVRAKNLAS